MYNFFEIIRRVFFMNVPHAEVKSFIIYPPIQQTVGGRRAQE